MEETLKVNVNGIHVVNKDYGTIDKRLAALEVHKELNKANTIYIISIVGLFVVAVFGNFNKWAGAGSAGCLTIAIALAIQRGRKRMANLEVNYNIEKPAPIIKLND